MIFGDAYDGAYLEQSFFRFLFFVPDVTATIFKSRTGYTATDVVSTSAMSVDNLDVEVFLDSEDIKSDDVYRGRWNDAEVLVFVLYNNSEVVILRRGWVGEITVRNGSFIAELRGLDQKIQQEYGRVYTPTCTAKLGDSKCRRSLVYIS